MRDFIKYLCGLLILLHFESFAQQPSPGEKIAFSSPQAAQLGKFGGHTINYSTGTPNINIPLLTLAEGDFKLPISVQYSYSGFRPSDQPAWVGVGFSLLAGGTVSRTIKGFADELSGFGYLSHASSIANFVNLSTPTYGSFATNIRNINDTNPDLFSFQFNGYSGKLVIDGTGAARVVSDTPIKVEYVKGTEPVHSSNQVILKWIFTVEDGTKYTFSNIEFTGGGGAANEYLPSAWHLSEVVNTKGDRITFEYTEAVPLSTARRIQYGRSDIIYNLTTSTTAVQSSSETVVSQNRTEEIFLTKIKGSTWELNFDSEIYNRFTGTYDGPINARKLNTIKLYNTTVTPSVKTNQFSFEYSDDNGARLHLQKITREGDNPYLMSYYSLAPSYIKGTDANVDYWGYYNGITNTNLIPQSGADLEPRLAPTLSGALYQLTYPTKGSTTIEYEQNSYSYVQNTVTSSTRIEVTDYYHRRYWNTLTNSLAQDGFTTIELSAPTTRVDVRLNNSSVAPAPVNCTSQGTYISIELEPGTYTPAQILSKFNFYPCNHPDAAMPGFDITLNIKVFRPVTSNTGSYGGVRVKTFTDNPGFPSFLEVNNFTYPDFSNPLLSSGVIAKEPFYHVTFSNTMGVHNMYRSTPFNPEALSPLYYRNVVSTTSQYQTTHSFTSHEEETDSKGKWAFAFDNGTGGNTHPAAIFSEIPFLEMGDFGSYDFMRSIPKEVVVRDLSGNLKHRTTYGYQGYHNATFQIPAVHYEVMGRYDYHEIFVLEPGEEIDQRTVYYGKAYYIVGGWPRKTSETITDYGSDGASPVTTTINYEYGTNHLQLNKQRTTQSDGSIEEINYKYPLDYSASSNTVLQSMIAANMVNYPVEQVTWLEKSPSDRKVIDANLTTYNSFTATPANHILPYKKFRFNGLNGSIGTFANYDGSSNENASASYRETVKFTHYDTQGNPLSLLMNGGEKISYLWSYKGQYPVAEMLNVDHTTLTGAMGGTSFEQMSAMTESAAIQTKLDAVRAALTGNNAASSPLYQMKSYLYSPLNGVSVMTDATGKSFFYEYDAAGRLAYIKNGRTSAGSIRAAYCYNYMGQNIPCNIPAPAPTNLPTLNLLPDNAATLSEARVSFNAVKEENSALLTLSTTTETKSDHFDIEHSLNGKDWTHIGSVQAKGESETMQYYSFKDNSPSSGENLYRVKMVDSDNAFAYTRIQSLTYSKTTSVYPNPLLPGQLLNLETSDLSKISHVKIYDAKGKQVYNTNKPTRQIDLNALGSGTYIVQITGTNGLVESHHVVKQ